MATPDLTPEAAQFRVENVGGIAKTSLTVPTGVTILAGENSTNRTSFLQAIIAVMGGTGATLKGDADEGSVRLDLGGETYERRLFQTGNEVQFQGDTYLEDPEIAELFAFLLETNEARQAVARENDLREIIMRPVDTEALKRDVERLKAEKREITDQLDTLESRKSELPNLEQRRTELRNKIEERREELADLETEIDDHNRDINQTRNEQEELDEKLEALRTTRSDLESVRHNIETQQEAIPSLKEEKKELEDELAALPEAPMEAHANVEQEMNRLRNQRQTLNSEISSLQNLIQYNKDRLEEDDYELLESLEDRNGSDTAGAITDQLVDDREDSVVCWTCGSEVDRDQIEDTIDRLQELRSQKVTALNDVKEKLEEVKSEQREAEQRQRRREELERKVDDIEDELDRREEQLASLKDQREELTTDVQTLETEVNEMEAEDFDEILDLHKQANELEFEIDTLESDLEDVTTEIEEIEALVETEDGLRDERADVLDELEDRRTKIGQIEQAAVDQFNDHMEAILDILDYDNLERIWIERIEETAFDLHVVRTTENGTAYEDTVDHLSESELEVTGLIFALAGYLVHDLHETVPFMLLDSLEAIDADRIAKLVGYFADYADFLVVALLEEDAQELDSDYHRITEI